MIFVSVVLLCLGHGVRLLQLGERSIGLMQLGKKREIPPLQPKPSENQYFSLGGFPLLKLVSKTRLEL